MQFKDFFYMLIGTAVAMAGSGIVAGFVGSALGGLAYDNISHNAGFAIGWITGVPLAGYLFYIIHKRMKALLGWKWANQSNPDNCSNS